MNTLWQMWRSGIDEDTVQKIITECEYYAPKQAEIGYDNVTGGVNSSTRRSEVRWIDKEDPNSKFIADLLWKYAQTANRNAFGFDITMVNEIQYTIYKSEELGKYDWHFDTFWANPTTYDRKLSVIIQLSDESEYEGGDFEIDKQYEQPQDMKQKGTVLVFPSFLQHRVTEVISGTRKSLVAWIEGPKFK